MQALAEDAQGRDPDQLLRARRASLLQHAGDDRRRTARSSAPIARATSPTGRATRRSSISAPATTGSRCGTCPARPHRRRHLLGPVVSRNRARDGADGRRSAVLSDRDRLRAVRRRSRHQPHVAPRDDRPRGLQLHAGDRRQPHRHGSTAQTLLRPQLHRRRMGRPRRRVRARGDRRAGRRRSTSAGAPKHRAGMGFFRDRRPQLYGRICEDI